MTVKKVGFSKMYMVPPSVWELVKQCVNEHEQKTLESINTPKNTLENENITSQTIQHLSKRDITPLSKSVSKKVTEDSNTSTSINPTSLLQSQDMLQLTSDHNATKNIPDTQINSPNETFSSSNESNISLSQHSLPAEISYMNSPKSQEISRLDTFDNFKPMKSSTPHNSFHNVSQPDPIQSKTSSFADSQAIIPVKTFPNCNSPIKTRMKTGAISKKTSHNNKFKCDYCNKYLSRKWNLKKHILMVHKLKTSPNSIKRVNPVLKRKSSLHLNKRNNKQLDYDRWNLNE
jgi:hypothetical protein